jgi:hypothetical protein
MKSNTDVSDVFFVQDVHVLSNDSLICDISNVCQDAADMSCVESSSVKTAADVSDSHSFFDAVVGFDITGASRCRRVDLCALDRAKYLSPSSSSSSSQVSFSSAKSLTRNCRNAVHSNIGLDSFHSGKVGLHESISCFDKQTVSCELVKGNVTDYEGQSLTRRPVDSYTYTQTQRSTNNMDCENESGGVGDAVLTLRTEHNRLTSSNAGFSIDERKKKS